MHKLFKVLAHSNTMSDIKSVTIIGAAGNLGVAVLDAFLKTNITVTVITRPESKSTFP
jgi:predicted dinucleotide-binding enzyme